MIRNFWAEVIALLACGLALAFAADLGAAAMVFGPEYVWRVSHVARSVAVR